MSKECYVFIAYGKRYVDEAIKLKETIEIFDKKRDFVLISDDINNQNFNDVINIEEEFKKEKNNHNKFCVLARILTPKYINYDKFIMIDTDILCINNPEYVWEIFDNDNCFNCVAGRDGDKWHWGHINEINKKLNMNMRPMHGGVVYFNKKNPKFDKYYSDVMYAYENYDKLGFRRKFRNNAMTDEILFSYSNDVNSILPFDFAEYPVVSFCLNPKFDIKQHIVSWGTPNSTHKTSNPTVFNHFTGLHESNNLIKSYNIWYEKIKKYYLVMDNTITAVTFLYDIGREKKGDGRKFSNYIKWLKETMKLNIPMVIYCEKNTYQEIKDVRNKYPLTRIVESKLEESYYLKYEDQIQKISKDCTFLKKIKNKERIEISKLPKYNLLQFSKFYFLKKTSDANYFNSKDFLWIDAGCSRFFNKINKERIWPNINKIDREKINIQGRSSLFNNITIDNLLYEGLTGNYLTGTLFLTGKDNIDFLEREIHKEFKYMISKNCINNEQIILAVLYKKYPNMFNVFVNKSNLHLQYFNYLSS